jgi:ribose 5-phosphate isomerase A
MAAGAQIDDHGGLSRAGSAMSNANEKKLAGEAAIRYVEDGVVVGVGTGSTVAFFIDALADLKDRIQGAVSSSEQSTAQLKKLGIPVLDLNATGPLAIYIDGADECDGH